MACFEAGALATGAAPSSYEKLSPDYSHMESRPGAAGGLYRAQRRVARPNFDARRRRDAPPRPTFSTDMANVSLAVPTIHPLVGIEPHGCGQPPARVRRRLHHPVGRRRRA
jgi:metal-dependent amidase/aminoacylase/carboxypeptidase family protein